MFRLLELIYYWDVWHRRICPGRYVAVQSMWAAMACILATLRIMNAKDEHGNPIAVVPEFTTGLAMCVSHYHVIHSRLKAEDARHPKSFPCSIEARSSRAEQLIQSRDCKWCRAKSNIFYYEILCIQKLFDFVVPPKSPIYTTIILELVQPCLVLRQYKGASHWHDPTLPLPVSIFNLRCGMARHSVCHAQICIFTISAPISTVELQRTLVYLYSLARRAKGSGISLNRGNISRQNFLPSLELCDSVDLLCKLWTFRYTSVVTIWISIREQGFCWRRRHFGYIVAM